MHAEMSPRRPATRYPAALWRRRPPGAISKGLVLEKDRVEINERPLTKTAGPLAAPPSGRVCKCGDYALLIVLLLQLLPTGAIRCHRQARSEQQKARRLWHEVLTARAGPANVRLGERRTELEGDVAERCG